MVPADTNSGELSYVLIVQQSDDLKEGEQTDGDQDMGGKVPIYMRLLLTNIIRINTGTS